MNRFVVSHLLDFNFRCRRGRIQKVSNGFKVSGLDACVIVGALGKCDELPFASSCCIPLQFVHVRRRDKLVPFTDEEENSLGG